MAPFEGRAGAPANAAPPGRAAVAVGRRHEKVEPGGGFPRGWKISASDLRAEGRHERRGRPGRWSGARELRTRFAIEQPHAVVGSERRSHQEVEPECCRGPADSYSPLWAVRSGSVGWTGHHRPPGGTEHVRARGDRPGSRTMGHICPARTRPRPPARVAARRPSSSGARAGRPSARGRGLGGRGECGPWAVAVATAATAAERSARPSRAGVCSGLLHDFSIFFFIF